MYSTCVFYLKDANEFIFCVRPRAVDCIGVCDKRNFDCLVVHVTFKLYSRSIGIWWPKFTRGFEQILHFKFKENSVCWFNHFPNWWNESFKPFNDSNIPFISKNPIFFDRKGQLIPKLPRGGIHTRWDRCCALLKWFAYFVLMVVLTLLLPAALKEKRQR